MTRRRNLTPEERDLWRQVTRDVKRRRPDPPDPVVPPVPTETPTRPAASPPSAGPVRPNRSTYIPRTPPPAVGPGLTPGLDKQTARRVRQGRLPIDGHLDLHGMRQIDAHHALVGYLRNAHARGKRLILVITGKGTGREGGGVLRANLPRWLNEPGVRELVLSIEYARPDHGGDGAYYVLLRRSRRPGPG